MSRDPLTPGPSPRKGRGEKESWVANQSAQNGPPQNWVLTALSRIAVVNPRTYDNPPRDEEDVSFVPMAAVEAESGRLDASKTRPWGSVNKGYTRFQEGDVLFAKITPCMENGKFALATGLVGGRAAGSTEFHVLRPFAGVNPKLLLFFLLPDSLRQDARVKMKGAAGQLHVPPEFLAELSVSSFVVMAIAMAVVSAIHTV